jgi:hypothetical protein
MRVSAWPQRTAAPSPGSIQRGAPGGNTITTVEPSKNAPSSSPAASDAEAARAVELAGAAPGPGVVAGVRQPDVADAGRGDHHHRHRAPRRRQLDDHPLVDREQAVDALDEGGLTGQRRPGT